jgi:uncharacterized protein (DUF1501 family)
MSKTTVRQGVCVDRTRRALLCASAARAVGIAAPWGVNLSTLAAANAQTVSDYRALVCIYLGGGNDHLNTVVPYDTTSFNAYAQARGPLARTRSNLLKLTATGQGGREAAFHPAFRVAPGNGLTDSVQSLYDAGRIAVVSNVGPMFVPVTKANYGSAATPLPPQLFSHSDQSNIWMSSVADGVQNGWGGLIGDSIAGVNSNAAFTTLSIFGYAKFLVGKNTSLFVASEAGAPRAFFDTGSTLDRVLSGSAARTNLLEKAYAQVFEALRDNANALADSVLSESSFPAPTGGGRSSVANQLLTVARIIGARNVAAIGAKRQVFYVQMGGYDTHSGQNERHDALMTELNDALVYFDACMGVLNLRDKVTLFTTSEFGRTLTSNGDGTDHGWGGHHLVMGAAVKGKEIYGALPEISLAGPDFLSEGNMIPRIAVDQYGATLAKWFGVSHANIDAIFPNLENFGLRDLGFLASL